MQKNLVIACLLIIVSSCKQEIAPENPCDKEIIPHADFILETSSGRVVGNDYLFYYNPFVKKDSIIMGEILQFRSEFADTGRYHHTWYIGSEVLHNYKEWRIFSNVPRPTYITISHAMRWVPNKLCFPDDDGYDSVTFTFKLADYYIDIAAFGKYRMHYDTLGAKPTDSVDIEFYFSWGSFRDSIVPNPSYNKQKISSYTYRLKGFPVSLPDGRIFPSQEFLLSNSLVISNTFMLFYIGQYCCGPIEETGITLINDVAYMYYYNFTRRYNLTGRKIN